MLNDIIREYIMSSLIMLIKNNYNKLIYIIKRSAEQWLLEKNKILKSVEG
jgi:hypothetical protein